MAVELRWTKAALLLTVFAVILALLSLLTEYYWLRVEVETDGPLPYFRTYDFYLMGLETGDSLRFYEHTNFGEIGGVITTTAALVVVWALFSLFYVSALADGLAGFYRGWLLMALSLSPLFYYTLSISAAADSCVDGHFESGLSPGPIILLLASLMQVAAVLSRNLQVLSQRISVRKAAQEGPGAGDQRVG